MGNNNAPYVLKYLIDLRKKGPLFVLLSGLKMKMKMKMKNEKLVRIKKTVLEQLKKKIDVYNWRKRHTPRYLFKKNMLNVYDLGNSGRILTCPFQLCINMSFTNVYSVSKYYLNTPTNNVLCCH